MHNNLLYIYLKNKTNFLFKVSLAAREISFLHKYVLILAWIIKKAQVSKVIKFLKTFTQSVFYNINKI